MQFSTTEELLAAAQETVEALTTDRADTIADAQALSLVAQNGGRTQAEAITLLVVAAHTLAVESTENALVAISGQEASVTALNAHVAQTYAEEEEEAFREFIDDLEEAAPGLGAWAAAVLGNSYTGFAQGGVVDGGFGIFGE
jgi:hypothetical protein